jgi:hypothetical protein
VLRQATEEMVAIATIMTCQRRYQVCARRQGGKKVTKADVAVLYDMPIHISEVGSGNHHNTNTTIAPAICASDTYPN